ncbi:hypothetical protein CHLNCDRAFT_137237 [Chlorella variabilis]|uniref:Uncharacterized protein n=1 Tax=Chlorella variabilis TaxID=554065 RepID=E1ZM08_CHLVA|nr:hypothetical protein CHLNCDRAFT_137237 [Chlorella variabilis]EFN52922.1 hypothetical protein CHLNCDRAFT_137237 [Chlorella variabilis]|eukprot:XP_005845024.1 hypothetical protein CHLNCDRAFT_137237 [Chlorella variabilis]
MTGVYGLMTGLYGLMVGEGDGERIGEGDGEKTGDGEGEGKGLGVGQGSGFVWDGRGHIATNFHVIRGASEVRVSLIDQSTWPAKIIGVRAPSGPAPRSLSLSRRVLVLRDRL